MTENGKLVEFHLDAGSTSEISGNVYKGRVVNVLEGMQAAFVNFGQAKNGYLYAGDIPPRPMRTRYRRRGIMQKAPKRGRQRRLPVYMCAREKR